jgi:hypothetical protein
MKAKRVVGFALAIVAAAAVLVGADALLFLRPVIAECWWRAALAAPVPELQRAAIRGLRSHATREAALALADFVDARSREGDVELAVRAAETLCLLSGRSFGSWFANCSAGRDWPKHAGDRWPEVVEQINAWRASAFGEPR